MKITRKIIQNGYSYFSINKIIDNGQKFLPAYYSPHLNPREQTWKILKIKLYDEIIETSLSKLHVKTSCESLVNYYKLYLNKFLCFNYILPFR